MARVTPKFSIFIVTVLFLSLLLVSQGFVRAADDSQVFPETGHTVSGKFLQYWKANGGLATYGYPITDAKDEVDPETGKTFLTQWFERNRFELHPENAGIQGGKYEVLLGLLGKDLRRDALTVDSDFVPADLLVSPAVQANAQVFFKETGHNLRLGFLDYWTNNGGLERFGYPIDEEHPEIDPQTGKAFLMQWFERARFEYHPENPKPYDILLGLLGNQIKFPKGNIDYAWKLGRSYNELNQPNTIAADTKGNVFVADRNYRVSKYTNIGQFVTRWGKQGSQSSEFSDIAGLATDKAGNVYVGDAGRNLVKKFDGIGNFLTQWELPAPGSVGAIATDNSGNVYVLNRFNDEPTIQKFDSNGRFIIKWGSKGIADGQFNNFGYYLGIDGGNNVYIVDNLYGSSGLSRIQKFDSNGSFLSKWSLSSENGINGLTVDAMGNTYILTYRNIMKYGNSGQVLATYGEFGSKDGQLNNPRAITIDSQGNLFVADELNDRVTKFNNQGQAAGYWGNRASSTDPGKFIILGGVAVDNQNHLQALDEFNHRIQVFDKQGNYLSSWGQNFKSRFPYLIVSDPHGNIILVNSDQNSYIIQFFDPNGNFLNKVSLNRGTGDGEASNLTKLAIDKQGNLFILDQDYQTGNVRLQKLDINGKFIRKWGSKGSGDSQFNYPNDIAIDSKGNVYVSDTGNNRIQKFDNEGKFLENWTISDSQTEFRPGTLATDNQDNIYAFSLSGILKLNPAGQVIANWGGFGSGDGQFNYVNSIAVDAQQNIYLTDGAFSRLEKFRQR